jgi:hypothetical protein
METKLQHLPSFASALRNGILLLIGLFCAVLSVNAQQVAADTGVEVKFLKRVDDDTFFQVRYDNQDGGRFYVIIQGENGETLYRQFFSHRKFSRIFQAPGAHERLLVIIRKPGTKEEHQFEITAEARIVQETYVKAVRN